MRTILPKQAKAKVEFRLVPDQDPSAGAPASPPPRHERFSRRANSGAGDAKTHQTPINHEFVDTVKRAAEEETGKWSYPTLQYSGRMYELAEYLRLPVVSVGVGYWDRRAHAPTKISVWRTSTRPFG